MLLNEQLHELLSLTPTLKEDSFISKPIFTINDRDYQVQTYMFNSILDLAKFINNLMPNKNVKILVANMDTIHSYIIHEGKCRLAIY